MVAQKIPGTVIFSSPFAERPTYVLPAFFHVSMFNVRDSITEIREIVVDVQGVPKNGPPNLFL